MNDLDDRQMAIYVGIDGSDDALQACAWAADYAAMTDIPIVLVHGLPDVEWYIVAAAVASEDILLGQLNTIGREALNAADTLVRRHAPTVSVDTVITRKPIATFMASASKTASLVVLGSSKHNAISDLVLGGNTIKICNAAKSPVLVWRSKHPHESRSEGRRPVVVGVDESEESRQAVLTAFEYARAFDAPLIAVNVWQIVGEVGLGYSGAVVDWERIRAERIRTLRELVGPLHEKFPDVDTTLRSVEGSAAKHLCALSADARLVVVGSGAHSKLLGSVLGSVSQNLIHHSLCPVLVNH